MGYSTRDFFDQVRAIYAPAAEVLGLAGPEESQLVVPCATYTAPGVAYEIMLDRDGTLECHASIDTDTLELRAGIEALAIAAGVVEKRGRVSYSARSLAQMRNSLRGLADYVQRVHPFLADTGMAEDLMRRAGAREWDKGGAP